ncbi:hypothetical protein FRACYDRAFT_247952 [Fragilariopsis cylindrus CCMP1102]|uniref:Uncharacterized protein n=1 Tax=Fragilariopsis cylindrus CCMP1102 TaxID=635003 RepID=A0A1E7EV67_9STRA|nr:hypothetical protein FRACYDRAFT_247952 [Fragilariopsis cylindrus CCMP1102]|eukprot:OEU09695.1 hypothetical protein FRACYDRAFT_247952 [Fragilariopsis cylindrus CCMP1102]
MGDNSRNSSDRKNKRQQRFVEVDNDLIIQAIPTTTLTSTVKVKVKKIHLLLSDPEIEWIQTRPHIFNTSIDFHKLRQFYVKAQHDPFSRSGHPDHNYAIDSAASSATATTNLLHGGSDDSVNNSNSNSSNNSNSNVNEVIINKVNGNPGIAIGDGPWLDFMIADDTCRG